jgi:uncharacterized membrane protein
MIRRWIGPIVLALVLGIIAYQLTFVATPAVLMRAAIKRVSIGGVNRLTAVPLANSASRTVVRPSPDLAYSACPYDLDKGPLAIDIAPVPALYWSLSVFDAQTNAAFVRNNRQANGAPMRIALALPGQSVPRGVETVRLDDARGIALLRILVVDRAAFPGIDAARRRSSCRTLG